MTALREDEDTVRIRPSSVYPAGVFEAKKPTSLQPDIQRVVTAAEQLDSDWRNIAAALQRENEELRRRNAGLVDENAQLRDTLAEVRGPR